MKMRNRDWSFRIQHGSETNIYHVEFDQDETPVSLAIVKAMAEITGEDQLALPPFADSVGLDSTALDNLFKPKRANASQEDSRLSFAYLEHRFTVHSDGYIEIVPQDDD